ncbi:hypothetical protein EWM64_g3817 [Hericium alpestre]|uniref:Uncharacterized protein n=1 Tax=Hericium alpestre TaxID=135208 RepID=A0A4Y9ZZC0_9AGAM|nr:hypothetical protein EWM64_g3817 [Hericium alpestre]
MNEPDFRPKSEPPVSIRLPRSADSLALLERLCGVLPLGDLRILEFTYNPADWSPETWVNVFGNCKRIEHVFVGGWNAALFCKALTYSVYKGSGEALRSRDLFFRNLRSLEVYDLNLFSLIVHEKINCRVIEVLKSQLRAREDMMHDDSDDEEECSESEDGDVGGEFDPRLDQLRISECSITRFYAEDMKDVVADVVWDECEGVYEKHHNEREDW